MVVEHFGTPLIALAGPGTGKTFCVIEKIKKLVIDHKIPIKQICAIIFTTAAAGENKIGPVRAKKGLIRPQALVGINLKLKKTLLGA